MSLWWWALLGGYIGLFYLYLRLVTDIYNRLVRAKDAERYWRRRYTQLEDDIKVIMEKKDNN